MCAGARPQRDDEQKNKKQQQKRVISTIVRTYEHKHTNGDNNPRTFATRKTTGCHSTTISTTLSVRWERSINVDDELQRKKFTFVSVFFRACRNYGITTIYDGSGSQKSTLKKRSCFESCTNAFRFSFLRLANEG